MTHLCYLSYSQLPSHPWEDTTYPDFYANHFLLYIILSSYMHVSIDNVFSFACFQMLFKWNHTVCVLGRGDGFFDQYCVFWYESNVFSNSLLFFLLCGIILYKETIIGLFIPRLVDISVIYTLGLFWIMLLCYYQNSYPLKIYTCTHFCEYIPRNVMSESQD